jgi:lipase maturation factor 1
MPAWALASPHLSSTTYVISDWLFLRALGVIYLAAFISLGVQVTGLIGRHGILPARIFLDDLKSVLGRARFVALPTLCWFHDGDGFLRFLCWGGAGLSILLIAGVAPVLTLTLLWACYLSLLNVSRVFLGYQWDVLLLETGFLAIWLAPPELLPHWPPHAAPHPIALSLARWLLFRLMFSSGVVKLRSGDETWRTLTALTYHYETQPLPTRLAWLAYQLPTWMHKVSCALMFLIELPVAFLMLAPPPVCYVAGVLTIALMLLIMATGNYCFFNLLAIALSLLLFDDTVWRQVLPAGATISSTWPWWVLGPMAFVLLVLSVHRVVYLFDRDVPWPRPLARLFAWLEPFHLVSGYGLFAVMTTTRPEIVIEGSDDGAAWKAYEFKWKPGDPTRPPRYCMPHQPRLDWQMWFAALGDYRRSPWFVAFLARLLENARPVVDLLRINPFHAAPPRYVRATVYRYQFSNLATRRATGEWWRRERLGLYCPVLTRSTEAGTIGRSRHSA